MSLWSSIVSKLKEIFKKMLGSRTIQNELKITPLISPQMENAIELWGKMYRNEAKWLHQPDDSNPTRVVSLGLASMVASEKARTALIEWKSEITPKTEDVEVDNPNYQKPEPDEFGNIMPSAQPEKITEKQPVGDTTRAEFMNEQYKKLKENIRVQLEYGIAKGGLVIKPYPVINKNGENSIEFDYVQADAFYPISFDTSKRITEAAFVQTKQQRDVVYRRLEYHKWEGNAVTVINKAFKSSNTLQTGTSNETNMDLGTEVPLTEVPEWSNLKEKIKINNVERPLFAYFRMPEANTIDQSSPLGVSGYSRATSLIEDADMQYSRMLWEYEGGELAIDIDRDALRVDIDANGQDVTKLSRLQQRLYRKVDLSQTGETYYPYTPALRDTNYINGLNTILMRIEDACSISRGTVSDPAAEARTATELKILKQRTYEANADIQTSLEKTLQDVVYIMNVYCDLYELAPEGEYDVSFEWDDSLLTDMDTELAKRTQLMDAGIYSKLELRMWYFGETEEQAKAALAKIGEESMEAQQNNLAMMANEANINTQAMLKQKQQDEEE